MARVIASVFILAAVCSANAAPDQYESIQGVSIPEATRLLLGQGFAFARSDEPDGRRQRFYWRRQDNCLLFTSVNDVVSDAHEVPSEECSGRAYDRRYPSYPPRDAYERPTSDSWVGHYIGYAYREKQNLTVDISNTGKVTSRGDREPSVGRMIGDQMEFDNGVRFHVQAINGGLRLTQIQDRNHVIDLRRLP